MITSPNQPDSTSSSSNPSVLGSSLNYQQAGKRMEESVIPLTSIITYVGTAIVCIKEEDELRWYSPITRGQHQSTLDDPHNNIRLGISSWYSSCSALVGTSVRSYASYDWQLIDESTTPSQFGLEGIHLLIRSVVICYDLGHPFVVIGMV